MMSTDELLLLLEAAVDAYNAGGSGDALAGKVTDLVAEMRDEPELTVRELAESDPKPFSSGYDALYNAYIAAGAPGSFDSWVKEARDA
jgi:hypothetical protein